MFYFNNFFNKNKLLYQIIIKYIENNKWGLGIGDWG